MDLFSELKGVRIELKAEELLKSLEKEKLEKVIKKIKKVKVSFLTKELLEELISLVEFESLKVIRPSPRPIAKEYEEDIKIKHEEEVTGKSRSKGKVEDFVNYFRNRFYSFRSYFNPLPDYEEIGVKELLKGENQRKVRIFCMIYDIQESKNGNIILTIEDTYGMGRAIIKKESQAFAKAQEITKDDVVMLYGFTYNKWFFVEDFDFPDVPAYEFPNVEKDLAVVYLSDTHFGSKYFLEKVFERFLRWLNGEGKQQERKLAEKVKYIAIAGDVVDGIGIYPGQDKELVVKDIYKQYEMFDSFVEKVPDYIRVIVIPGNHDAVRRAEPMPAISKEIIKSDVIRAGNPAIVEIEGIKHLLYHGTSMDSLIAAMPKLSYEDPNLVMATYLKKRHLSPIYGENPIVPEKIDYLLIRTVPNVVHTGHVHRFSAGSYRKIALINSATFQDQTDYQLKQGHIPTPGVVPVFELRQKKINVLDFKKENIFA